MKKLDSPNRDIQRLEEAGFALEIRDAHLVVHGVPYVTPGKKVAHGKIIAVVDAKAEGGVEKDDHQIWWIGEYPSNLDGSPLPHMSRSGGGEQLDVGLKADLKFSMKLKDAANANRLYAHDFEKIGTYHRVFSAPAFELDPEAAASPPNVTSEPIPETPFLYPDTASARAGIVMIARKLVNQKIAIVGVGGTGSYVLDLVAKTRVGEIHLYDGDTFDSHNAYRAPGAATEAEAHANTPKVEYFASIYARMRKGVIPHSYELNETNAAELDGMTFVFLCMDTGPAKEALVAHLEGAKIPFVDTGLSLRVVDDKITGLVRATTSSEQVGDVRSRNRLSFRPPDKDDPYRQNVQLVELNTLNAVIAVIRWKKLFGFYADAKAEHHSTYDITGHFFTAEDRAGYVEAPDA